MPTREELHEVCSLGTEPRAQGAPWRLECCCGWRSQLHLMVFDVEAEYDAHRAEVGMPERPRMQFPLDRLREGLAGLGFTVGLNPDGVDDTVAATLLIVSDLREENQRLALENAELRGSSV